MEAMAKDADILIHEVVSVGWIGGRFVLAEFHRSSPTPSEWRVWRLEQYPNIVQSRLRFEGEWSDSLRAGRRASSCDDLGLLPEVKSGW